MKRVILICPDVRAGFEPLASEVSLALSVFLGKPLVDHALDGLARSGVTDVLLLVSDRPTEVRDYVTNGQPWGLRLTFFAEAAELSPADALGKHAAFGADAALTLDELPQAPGVPVLTSLQAWHAAHEALLPHLVAQQVGVREHAPGVWLGLRARVAPDAVLRAPCWIGPNVNVLSGASVGPGGFVEEGSMIDAGAEVIHSNVAQRTYLGSLTHLHESIALGATLVNWRNGSCVKLADAFLLSRLDPPHEAATSVAFRLLAAFVMFVTSPLLLLAAVRSWVKKLPVVRSHVAVLPSAPSHPQRHVTWHELPGMPDPWRRWPRLWSIVRGHFAWTGNPPLSPAEAAALEGEFERLWLNAAPGFFTAPEAEGSLPPWDDAARAHAALFACKPTFEWCLRIVRHGLRSLFSNRSQPAH